MWHQKEISELKMLLLKDKVRSWKELAMREAMKNSVDRGRMSLKRNYYHRSLRVCH